MADVRTATVRSARWRWAAAAVWLAPAAGVATALAIEATQLWVVDHRSPQWNDVRWNSVGVLAGLALWGAGALAWRQWRP